MVKRIKIFPIIPAEEEEFDPVELLGPEWEQNREEILKAAKYAKTLEDRIEACLLIGSSASKTDKKAFYILESIISNQYDDPLVQDAAQDALDVLKMRT